MELKNLRFLAAALVALAAIGLLAAVVEYFNPASGISGTPGAVLVIVSSTLIVGATFIVGFPPAIGAGLQWTLEILILLGLIGTLAAAWLLHSWILLACMALGLVIQIWRMFNVRPLLSTHTARHPDYQS
jgi:hypothetical protein